ncbi:MAG: hypothetical protein QXJ62_05385 [Nitrososphaeria archaeon]
MMFFRVMDVHSYGRRVALVEAKLKGPNGEVAKAFLNHLRIKGKSVHGKTGLKCLPLVLSFRPLLDWLNIHPQKDDPNAPLWPSRYGKGMCYQYFRNVVKRCAIEAGLKKAVWPYLFRHTQLTWMAKKLTEAKLALYAG